MQTTPPELAQIAVLNAVEDYVQAVDDGRGHVADAIRDVAVQVVARSLGVAPWTAEDLFEYLVEERNAGRV